MLMRTLSIPPRDRPGFSVLLELPEQAVEDLGQALETAPATFSTPVLMELVAPRVQSISARNLEPVFDTLLSLYALRAHLETSVETFAEDVCRAIEQGGANGLQLRPETREQFRRHLVRLLSIPALSVGAKSIDVWLEQERVFHDARIITDIRPVFGTDVHASPNAALLVHTLRITYHQDNDLKQFFVAMSQADVTALRAVLDRATEKADSLVAVLEQTDITYTDIT
jgi:hypothetical protein